MIRQMALTFDSALYAQATRVVEDGLYDEIEAVVDYYQEGGMGIAILAWKDGRDDPARIQEAFTERVGECEVLSTDLPYIPDGLPCQQAESLHQAAQQLMLRERLGVATDEEREDFMLRQAHATEQSDAAMSEHIDAMREHWLDEEDEWP